MTLLPSTPPRFVLAIDPGKATGLAWVSTEGEYGYAEVEGRFNLYAQVREWASTGAIPEIVIEDYTVDDQTANKSRQVDAWRIIGYLEGVAEQNGWPFTIQDRGVRGFGSDAKLAALGWNPRTKGGHAREATRHLLTYLVRHHGGPDQLGAVLLRKIMDEIEDL